MRAIRYDCFGDYDQLQTVEIPPPRPDPGQAVVRVRFAGVSPLDNTVRAGHLPHAKTPPLVPGVGAVGVVVEPGGSSLAEGTRVLIGGGGLGVRGDGTWRELLAVSPELLAPLPPGVTDEDAIALTTGGGYLTAYLALTHLARFAAGKTVLAPGIGGAVGQGGVEIARALGATKAISTASRTDKAEQGRAVGYDVIDLSRESLRDGIARRTDGRGVDVVLDGVGGPITGPALGSLASGGTLVSIGYSGGTDATISVTDLIWRSAHVVGFMMSLFTPEQLADAQRAVFALLVERKLRPTIARTFPLVEAAAAQRHLIEDRPFGRVVLSI